MTERMTPDEARRLLDGTTPGPWDLSSSRSVVGIDIVMYDGTVMERRNVALAAAAPTLAATIAGMHTEYAVEHQHTPGGQWHQITGWSHEPPLNDGHTLAPDERIIRRYVTEPEEA